MHTCSGTHVRCYATGGVGAGWGGSVHVLRTCTHEHIFTATQHDGSCT